MKTVNKTALGMLLMFLLSVGMFAQVKPRLVYEPTSETTIFLKAVYNEDKQNNIAIVIDGGSPMTIAAGGSLPINAEVRRFVKSETSSGNIDLWRSGDTKSEWRRKQRELTETSENKTENPKEDDISTTSSDSRIVSFNQPENNTFEPVITDGPLNAVDIISSFRQYADIAPYYSTAYMQSMNVEVNNFIEILKFADQKKREQYINEHGLKGYVVDARQNLRNHRDSIDTYIQIFLDTYYKDVKINDEEVCINGMRDILKAKLMEREDVVNRLDNAIGDGTVSAMFGNMLKNPVTWILLLLLIAIMAIVSVVYAKHKKNTTTNTPTVIPGDAEKKNAQDNIVVRRKTTSILKKQSLDDVYNNPSYKKIDCSEFCDGGTVRAMYIKSTCIKEIYNMYAEDLRNPDNPNEDGCMVLGRWVLDEATNLYDVTLEEIVQPGDDAVFQEYELNFGGKIKLKVSDRLRRLRRETNLQYDMTCWVHSHPGLGVFFSTADCNVQMQLKHPTHPKFLTAIVIDILTPEQDFGIFTFKHDMSILSKPELKKMYSLEKLHKWAVENDRNSVNTKDYYNLMSPAGAGSTSCHDVYLSNGAIIDMSQYDDTKVNDIAGWIHGYTNTQHPSSNISYVVNAVDKNRISADDELLGCFVVGSHCSLPTIRRIVGDNINNICFVIFYSQSADTVTVIPVKGGVLSEDEGQYGEEKLENLKIWTRRKR